MITTSGSENSSAATVMPKVPVVADPKGRLRVSKAQRRDILAALDRSNESVPQFARRTGLKYSTLSRWVQPRRPKPSAHPIVQVAALLAIIDLLDLNGLEIRSVRDEHKSQSKESCHVDVATGKTSHTPVRKPRDRAADPGGEKVRMRRIASRADRSGRQSFKSSGRRSQ